jgi:hypothetical protein
MREKRVAKLGEGAAKLMQPGEEVREVVQAQTGADPSLAGARAVEGIDPGAVSFVLIVTDRHVYAITLGGGRLLDPREVRQAIPLEEASVTLTAGQRGRPQLAIGRAGAAPSRYFVMKTWDERAAHFAELAG